MAQEAAPSAPRLIGAFVERDGRLSRDGMVVLEQMWRQVVAGFVIVPCQASGINAITLTPTMHEEGGRSYADHMAFAAPAVNTSTDVVTARVGARTELKVYKNGGANRAGSGDVVASSLYLFVYYAALDGGNGGFVLIGVHQPLDATLTALAAYNTNGLIAQTAPDTFAGRTITGTTDRITLTYGDGVSGDPTVDIASGYVGQESITTLGEIGTGEWSATKIAVRRGGTGQTSYTNGQLLIGNTTNNTLTKATLTAGTGVTIANGNGSITPAVDQAFSPTWTGTHRFNLAINLASGNIDFPATQIPSAVANTLDDYEEAQNTAPTISFATPGTSSFAYGTRTITSVKVGQLVLAEINITFTPTIGTGSGTIIINSAPHTAFSADGPAGAIGVLNANFTWPAGVTSVALLFNTTTTFRIVGKGSAIAAAVFAAANLTNGASHSIQGSIVYRASA